MASEALPDHYKALGVEKTADAATIKATYRKLVLKCHPDKVTDPALKAEKQEEFHIIQQAYEVLVDDDKRADYEARLTLEALRREKAARTAAGGEKTARFDVRTSSGASFRANGPTRYSTEERKPSRSYDDEHDTYFDDRDRSTRTKYETYPSNPPKAATSPRSGRPEKESSKSAKASSDRTRSDRNKTRDREERRERKFNSVESESSADEKARYEQEYKRRSEADARRKTEDRRSYEDNRYPGANTSARKMSTQEEEAIRYLHKSRAQVEAEIRPTPIRTSSRDYYGDSRSSRKESRPEAVRRSSARPSKDRPSTTSGRDRERGFPEIVEWGGDDSRRPPTLKAHSSSPANFDLPRAPPQRSYTDAPRDHRATTSPPPPSLSRAQTMPAPPHQSSSHRKNSAVPRQSSSLRETMTTEHTSPERNFPTMPLPQPASASKTKYYHYPSSTGGVSLRPEDLAASGHRTELREPVRHRTRSPSPMLSRPPIGANRPSEANIPKVSSVRPSLGRTDSYRTEVEERGRSRPLYGELGSRDPYSRVKAGTGARQSSFGPESVQYAKNYGPEDVRWAPRSRENDREYGTGSKPGLSRAATMAY
jgi:curved DNA-binding protein CbpA